MGDLRVGDKRPYNPITDAGDYRLRWAPATGDFLSYPHCGRARMVKMITSLANQAAAR